MTRFQFLTMPSIRPVFLVAIGMMLGPVSLAQGPHGGNDRTDPDKIRPCQEFDGAQKALEKETDPEKWFEHLSMMVEHVQHGLPHKFDEETRRRKRDRGLGPLRDREGMPEFIRELVRNPRPGKENISRRLAVFLADDPTTEDLSALSDGFQHEGARPDYLASLARALGRAIAKREEAGGKADLALVTDALANFRVLLASSTPALKAAAIEGLFRAGRHEEMTPQLESLLLDPTTPIEETVRLLGACQELFKSDTMNDGLVSTACDIARNFATRVLEESKGSKRPSSAFLTGMSGKSQLFQTSLKFLREVSDSSEFDFLLRCFRESNQAVIGMEELQNVRYSLQRMRKEVSDEQRETLDSYFTERLQQVASRLIELEENPLAQEERNEFFANKDARYNAICYFVDLWDQEDLRERWMEFEEAPDLLYVLSQSIEDHATGESPPFFTAVQEKLENRVMAVRLLVKMHGEDVEDIVDLDPVEFFLTTLCTEMGAPLVEVMGAFEHIELSPYLMVEVPEVQKPFDGFVRNQAAEGLRELGFHVLVSARGYVLSLRKTEDVPGDKKAS